MQIRPYLLLTFISIFILSGCTYNTIGDSEQDDSLRLEEAESIWKSKNISSYSVEIEQYCFCGGPTHYRMIVRADSVSEIIDLRTGKHQEQLNPYQPVSEWFVWLKQAAEKDPVRLELKFDNRYGYPISIDYDLSTRINDEEMQVTFKNLYRL